MGHIPRRIAMLFLLGWMFPAAASAQAEPGDGAAALDAVGRPLVYRLQAGRLGKVDMQRASAGLLDVESRDGATFGLLATCFHAMADADSFLLSDERGGTVYD